MKNNNNTMDNHTDPDEQLGATTAYLLQEVKKRGIPYMRFHDSSLFILGYGSKQKMLRTAVTGTTSGLGIEMAGDKDETKRLLSAYGLPTPKGFLVYDEDELKNAFAQLRLPVVVKPLDGNHGRGVTTHIETFEKAAFGFRMAKQISDAVIVEEFLEGDDHRFLVIDFKLVAVAKRTPAMVVGDGKSTIQQLMENENNNPERGYTSNHVLAPIEMDESTMEILSEKNLSLLHILPEGETLYLKDTANISAGGISTDLTEVVHPDNVFLAERVAKIFNLDICGIDIISQDIRKPLSSNNGGIIEVNAGPGLRMHSNPTAGKSRDVAAAIVDMLFPDGNSRIPVVAMATPESTAVLNVFFDVAQKMKSHIAYHTSAGIYVNDKKVGNANSDWATRKRLLLFDPTVDMAIIDCMQNKGEDEPFIFDACDIAIVHPKDGRFEPCIFSLAKHIAPGGYMILDADGQLDNILPSLTCHYALYGTEENITIQNHVANGGLAVITRNGKSVAFHHNKEVSLGDFPHWEYDPSLFAIGVLSSIILGNMMINR